jgi:hypothetical protein
VAFVAAVAGASAAAVAVACGPGDIGDLTAGRGDAGMTSEAAVDAAVCVHAAAPERPTTPDGPNTPPVVLAFQGVRFDTGEEGTSPPKPRGLDLDTTCTCAEPKLEPESCIPPDASSAPRPCDGVDGRDNAAGPLLAAAAATGGKGIGPAAFQDQVEKGAFDVIVSVIGWNGLPDDPSVVLGVQLSAGTEGIQVDGGRQRPRFDGTDVWTVTPGSVLGGGDLVGRDCRTLATTCIPAKVDSNAYVRGGVLVGHLDLALPVITTTSSFVLEFAAATFTAVLSKEGDHHRAVGEIAGRWPIERLLPSLARIPNPLNPGRALCASDAGLEIYRAAKKTACGALDLATDPVLDRTNARCDAISNAISFTAVTATLGTVYEGAAAVDECAGFADDCTR